MTFQNQNNPKPMRTNVDGSKPDVLSEEEVLEQFTQEEIIEVNNMALDTLEEVTKSKSFFRLTELINKIKKVGDKRPKFANHPYFEDLVTIFVNRLDLIKIGQTGSFTTRDVDEREKMMIALSGRDTDDHILDNKIVQDAIDARKGISEEQIAAVLAACFSNRAVTVIEGTAGAGKSFTMAAVKKAYIDSGYHVMGTALSWNAAGVLAASTGLSDCEALQGLINKIEEANAKGTEYFRKPTLLIVDEAGLVGSKHMFQLLKATFEAQEKVKVVLTGDSLQLNPVDAGSALEAIVDYHGTTRIDTIRRQKQASHRQAVKRFSERKSGQALYPFLHQECIHWCQDKESQFNVVVRDFLSYKLAYPNKKPLILALSNKDVSELNKRVRAAYKKMGLVYGTEVNLSVTDGREIWKSSFAVGDEVVMRANSKDLVVYKIPEDQSDFNEDNWQEARVGVFNRNNGRVVAVKRSENPLGSFDIIVDMSGDLEGRVVINTKKFKHQDKSAFPLVHNFATTIYASQGQTVNKVLLVDSPRMDFRLSYVGMSRHTDSVDIYLDETELHTRIDYVLGKARPKSLKEQNRKKQYDEKPEELPVQIGRYSRKEMLYQVSAAWGKLSLNQTAMVYEKQSRLQDRKNKVDNKELAKIQLGDPDDPVTDFDDFKYIVKANEDWKEIAENNKVNIDNEEEFNKWVRNVKRYNNFKKDEAPEEGDILYTNERLNVSYPIIDLQKLMQLPDPINESILINDTDVQENNYSDKDLSSMPLKEEKAPVIDKTVYNSEIPVIKEKKEEDTGIHAFGFLFRKKKEVPVKEEVKEESSDSILDKVKDKIFDKIIDKPEIEIPFLPEENKIAIINRKGNLEFLDSVQGISDEFLKQTKDIFWSVGRGHQPRILSRASKGEVVARYSMDGRCVTGEGYPPMLLNPNGTQDTKIMIVPGAKEWMWSFEYHENKNADTPEKIPHLIWGAKDVDWRYIYKSMVNKTVVLARGQNEDKERIEWAIKLQEKLWNKFGVKGIIHPSLPDNRPDPWNASVNEEINKPSMKI